MKILQSNQISAFGGINFVYEYLDKLHIDAIFNQALPDLAHQSKYSWKDVIYSLFSIFYCGGDCIEDLQINLRDHLKNNPFIRIPSPDTLLRRIPQLSEDNQFCQPDRGSVTHCFNYNQRMSQLNICLLSKLGIIDQKEITLDYDNTIIFNEKQDSKLTYKKDYGYQPGVCTLNEEFILFLENRNGNSDAKSFQHETLERMFILLSDHGLKRIDHFRADAASYQYKVVKLVEAYTKNFYIGCRNSYVEKYFEKITEWNESIDSTGSKIEVGEITITPFEQKVKKDKSTPRQYRLIVKRKPNENGQINVFTQDAYEYKAILTNNTSLSPRQIVSKYNQRGNMEKQFDIMKNDFGWNHMPFSNLASNTVFLYLMAMCRNLYKVIIEYFSTRFKGLKPTYRMKKFIFRFILFPAKWVIKSRQHHLRVFSKINFKT